MQQIFSLTWITCKCTGGYSSYPMHAQSDLSVILPAPPPRPRPLDSILPTLYLPDERIRCMSTDLTQPLLCADAIQRQRDMISVKYNFIPLENVRGQAIGPILISHHAFRHSNPFSIRQNPVKGWAVGTNTYCTNIHE